MLVPLLVGAVGVCAGCLGVLIVKGNYHRRILHKLGVAKLMPPFNWVAFSWESCLNKINCEGDIVFFGDSITQCANFHLRYPQCRIVNLGCSGDTLGGMLRRVGMVQGVNPKKVFVLGGINGLTNYNIPLCVKEYAALLDAMKAAVPLATIYVQSVLPISHSREKTVCKNTTIAAFNQRLETLAAEKGCVFIDLYPLYECDGQLDAALSVDGLHLKSEAYDRWEQAIHAYMTETDS